MTSNLCYIDERGVKVGKLLGKGGYAEVFEVHSLSTGVERKLAARGANSQTTGPNGKMTRMHSKGTQEESMTSNVVIKLLKLDDAKNVGDLEEGYADLINEARILSAIQHSNIISVHGCSTSLNIRSPSSFGFFLVLDRMNSFLCEKLQVWSSEANNSKIRIKKLPFLSNHDKMLGVRLKVARDLSSAMSFLHEKNIIYRDLKPENIGFDKHGTLKLFDFGLSKDLTSAYKNPKDGTYDLTFTAGTCRYMAPEVGKCLPYNLSADVYSFGILLWQICSLKVPFDGYNSDKHSELVVYGGERPEVKKSWPLLLKQVLISCWSNDLHQRPKFQQILMILEELISFYSSKSMLRHIMIPFHPKMKYFRTSTV